MFSEAVEDTPSQKIASQRSQKIAEVDSIRLWRWMTHRVNVPGQAITSEPLQFNDSATADSAELKLCFIKSHFYGYIINRTEISFPDTAAAGSHSSSR